MKDTFHPSKILRDLTNSERLFLVATFRTNYCQQCGEECLGGHKCDKCGAVDDEDPPFECAGC